MAIFLLTYYFPEFIKYCGVIADQKSFKIVIGLIKSFDGGMNAEMLNLWFQITRFFKDEDYISTFSTHIYIKGRD